MMTIDNLLLKIVNFKLPSIDESLNAKDAKVLRSLANSVNSPLFITENQSRLLVKILRENTEKLPIFKEEITLSLQQPSWSKNFRHIEQVRKFYIAKNSEQELHMVVEFTFSSEIRKILSNLSQKLENLINPLNSKLWYADLTEQNIVSLVEALDPLGFEIDATIKNHYDIIKSWSQQVFRDQFLITNIEYTNFQRAITADLGIETAIDQNIINDRSVRYQYFVENPKNSGETLTEYIANRSKTKIWIDKNQHSLSSVFESLINLRRMPVLVVFDTIVNEKYLENLQILSDAIENVGLQNNVGIYFRLPNDVHGKKFNSLIAEKQYNKHLDENLIVGGVMSGKIPKFFLTNPWKPMSVIALDTKMGLRHGKTSVYTNCCDLVIEYAEEKSILEERKITWR